MLCVPRVERELGQDHRREGPESGERKGPTGPNPLEVLEFPVQLSPWRVWGPSSYILSLQTKTGNSTGPQIASR